MTRAIWKGRLRVGSQEVGVKLYSAIEDRKVRFRLLHASDHAPVEQRIVRKDDGKEVAKEDRRKAYPLGHDTAVILQPEELARLEPPESREITLCRFVPNSLVGDQWYDRPYYLGPDEDEQSYFALSQALQKRELVGIARWVMRKKRYLGVLEVNDGYLVMITLRRAEQVLSFSGIEPTKAAAPTPNELKLAEQLVSSIAGDFQPERWEDEYRKRLCQLIEAKTHGKHIEPVKPRRRPAQASLAESLKASIAAARERKVA